MNIIEAIKERRSIRTFDGNGISSSQREMLIEAIDKSYNPFGTETFIRLKKFDLKQGYKPSTYGTIKGAEDFFLIGYGNDKYSMLGAGFQFEQVVLKSWEIGLGTCWIAATFKGSDFEKGENFPDDVDLKIICPVGVAANQTFREKLTRMAVRSSSRKPFDELFRYKNINNPIPEDNIFRSGLEMMRLAPSSTNSQPWRAIVEDNEVHFYYVKKSSISLLDCGIGLCHFYETEKYYNRNGHFYDNHSTEELDNNWEYLISYTLK